MKPGNVLLTPTGHGEGHRLRHRARGHERRPHPDRLGHGHRHLLLARAGAGPRGRRPQRRVLARRRALRDGHRRRAVHRRLAGARSRTSTCAKSRSRRRSATPTSRPTLEQIIIDRARQGSRAPLPDAPTTCAPTSCASAAAGRSPPRPSPRSSPTMPDRGASPTRGTAAYAASATVASPRVAGRRRAPAREPRRAPRTRRCSRSLTLLVLALVVGGILFAAIEARQRPGHGHGAQRRRQDRRPGATQTLADAAPRPGHRSRSPATKPVGTVIARIPKRGAERQEGQRRSRSASARASAQVTIPDITGTTRRRRDAACSPTASFKVDGRPRAVEQHRRPGHRSSAPTRRPAPTSRTVGSVVHIVPSKRRQRSRTSSNLPQRDRGRASSTSRASIAADDHRGERHGPDRQRDLAPTRPPAPTTSRRGSAIKMFVSTGAPQVTGADVVGHDRVARRKATLDGAEPAVVGRRSQPRRRPGNDGKVIEPETRPAARRSIRRAPSC